METVTRNDPPVVLTDADRAMIEWFNWWLEWMNLPYETRVCTPEPIAPKVAA
jgi:hypothetical protein